MKREKTLTEYTSVISGPGIDEIYGILRSAVIPDPVQETSATNELYFIRDYLGNIKSIFDNNGEMLYYRLYDEFGGEFTGQSRSQDYADQTDLTQPCFTPFGFTSREFDEIADLYFYRSRYYDPQIGRFTQRDKFNEAGFITGNPAVIYNPLQLNDYTYVGNNPLIYTDPWGFCVQIPWYDKMLFISSDFFAGFADTITFNRTRKFRQWLNYDDVVDKGSWSYFGGEISGFTWQMVTSNLKALDAIKIKIYFQTYPHAGGGGLVVKNYGLRVISFDIHKINFLNKSKYLPHIDIPGVVKHFPWNKISKIITKF